MKFFDDRQSVNRFLGSGALFLMLGVLVLAGTGVQLPPGVFLAAGLVFLLSFFLIRSAPEGSGTRVEDRIAETTGPEACPAVAAVARTATEAPEAPESGSRPESEFLASMSHEIRTPLNGIIGASHLLRETSLDEEQDGYLDVILSSGAALMEIVNNVLDMSKIEAGRLELDPRPFDLEGLVQDLVGAVGSSAREKGVRTAIRFAPDVPRQVVADRVRLRQMLTNLLGNAVKFTAAGCIVVEVEVVQSTQAEARIRISVVDTGPGIPPDQQERIFEKYGQADITIASKYGGSGLGLPITCRLARLMGGEVGLQSQVGKGSTFWIEVPLSLDRSEAGAARKVSSAQMEQLIPAQTPVPEQEPRSSKTESPAPAGTGPQATVPARVLVVEDTEASRLVATRILEKLGSQEIHHAKNGRVAVQMTAATDYDLILMDCMMPEMDGYEATRLIRQLEGGRHRVAIVAMTARALPGDRERCLVAGMDEYLSKPVTPKALKAVLDNWRSLGESGSRAGGEDDRSPGAPDQVEEPVLDLDQALANQDGDVDLLFDIVGVFLTRGRSQLRELERSVTEGDVDSVMVNAHACKGSASNFCARGFCAVAGELEALARSGSLDGAEDLFGRLAEEYQRLRQALEGVDWESLRERFLAGATEPGR